MRPAFSRLGSGNDLSGSLVQDGQKPEVFEQENRQEHAKPQPPIPARPSKEERTQQQGKKAPLDFREQCEGDPPDFQGPAHIQGRGLEFDRGGNENHPEQHAKPENSQEGKQRIARADSGPVWQAGSVTKKTGSVQIGIEGFEKPARISRLTSMLLALRHWIGSRPFLGLPAFSASA